MNTLRKICQQCSQVIDIAGAAQILASIENDTGDLGVMRPQSDSERMEDFSWGNSSERDTLRSVSTIRDTADELCRPEFGMNQRNDSDTTTSSAGRKSLDDSDFECSKSETSISSNSAPMTPDLFPERGMFYNRSFEDPGTLQAENRNVSMQHYRHESMSLETVSSSNLQPCYPDGLWPPNFSNTESAFAAMLVQGTSMAPAGNWFSTLSDLPGMADGSAFSTAGFGGPDSLVWS